MKLHKTKEKEIYYYFLKNKEKRFMYRHFYYDVLGKRKEKSKSGFKTEKAALRSLLEIKAAILNDEHQQVEMNNMTVSQWLDIWYETYSNNWEVTSKLQRENAIKYQMKPLLGKYKLNDLSKSTYIREYVNVLLKTYKPSTVSLFHRLFKIAINAAVDEEIITRNRFNNVIIEQDDTLDNFLTPGELNTFLSYAKKYENITNYTYILLLSYTGLRKGEALGLKWQDVDLTNKTISINKTRDRYGTRTPKTKNSIRTLLLDDVLVSQLKKYKTWCKQTKFMYGESLDKEKDYVLISYQGGTPIGANTIKYVFHRLYKRMKKDDVYINEITAHGLRHTHCTILISNRVQIKTIADRLGNTPEMIYNIYSHSFEELEQEAVSIFTEAVAIAGSSAGRNK